MANPLFEQMQIGNVANPIMQGVMRLKQQISGDPNDYIQKLLNSGRITQEQYNQAVERAKQLREMFNRY